MSRRQQFAADVACAVALGLLLAWMAALGV